MFVQKLSTILLLLHFVAANLGAIQTIAVSAPHLDDKAISPGNVLVI
jgi:hypothetical protein